VHILSHTRITGFHDLQFFIHIDVCFLNIIAVAMARIMEYHDLQFFVHIGVCFSNIIAVAMARIVEYHDLQFLCVLIFVFQILL
jgi:hypothetical protein